MDALYYKTSSSAVLQRPQLSSHEIEAELVNDYWVAHNLGLKKVHERKQAKRVQRLGPLGGGKAPVAVLSQSLSSLPQTKSLLLDKSPIKSTQQRGRDDATAAELHDADSIEPYRVNEIMSRVTFGDAVDRHHEEEEGPSVEDLATHGREIQFDTMKESAVMNQVMREVLALHGTVAEVVDELQERQDVCARVDLANHTYVRLFERMLAEVLRMQRSKFQSTAKTMSSLKQELANVRSKEIAGRDRVFAANTLASQAEMTVAGLRSDLTRAQREVERLTLLAQELEDENRGLQTTIEVNGKGISPKEVKKMIKEARQEEVLKSLKEKSKERAKFLKESEARIKEALDASKPESKSMSELTEEAKKANDFKRPKVDGESQTEVDEHGVWDKADGWTMPISGTVVARRRWRDAIKYSKCPKCKGTGDFVALCARLLKAMVRGMPVNDDEQRPKGAKQGSVWQVPDDLVRFMSNLPRSVQALNPRPLTWALRRVWVLCHDKKVCDDADSALGYSIQSTPEFLIEYYLKQLPTRSEAEMATYELIQALQEHHRAHPLLHTFARFIGVLDGLSAEELVLHQKNVALNKKKAQDKKNADSLRGLGVRELTAKKAAADELFRDEEKRKAGRADAEENLKMCDCALSPSIFTVYQFARACLLETYTGAYARKIAQTKAAVPLLGELEAKVDKEPNVWAVNFPAHICVDSKLRFFVPIDRAMRVLAVLLSFMDEKLYQAALRTVEASAVFLNPDGSLYLLDGMHSLVRSQTRDFLMAETLDGSDLSFLQVYEQAKEAGRAPPRDDEELGPMTADEAERDKPIIMVDLDQCLRVVVECMALRTKFVEKRLSEIFVEGDDNGDGVLSFKEFTSIVAVVAPHFSERRIIRMFREALMFGNDDDSISPTAFVLTCKGHNLVQLCDVRELRTGLLRALCLTDEQKQVKNLAAAAEKARLEELAAAAFGGKSTFMTPSQRRASVLQNASMRRSSSSVSMGLGLGLGRKMSLLSAAKSVMGARGVGTVAAEPSNRFSTRTAFLESGLAEDTAEDRDGSVASAVTSRTSTADGAGDARISTAGSPGQMALVELYAQTVAVGSEGQEQFVPSPLPSPASPITRPGATVTATPTAYATASEDAAPLPQSSPKASISFTLATLATAQLRESDEDSSGSDSEGPSRAAAPNPAPAPASTPSPATAPNPPVAVVELQAYTHTPSPTPAAAAAAAAFIPRGALLAAGGPAAAQPNAAASRQSALQVKEQLRLRREGRLRLALKEKGIGGGGGSLGEGMNDSDEDN